MGTKAEARGGATVDEQLRREEVRLVERAEEEGFMAVEAPLVM